jgi:hypothetical protein
MVTNHTHFTDTLKIGDEIVFYLKKLGPKGSMSLGGNSNNIFVSLVEGGDENYNFERVQHLQRTIRLLCVCH